MERIIAPSLLSANFGNLDADIEMLNRSECDWFHLDIMDGVFVPNISFGFPVLKHIAAKAQKPLDAHLMIVDPDRYIGRFADMGVQYLSVHYEACTHLHRSLQNIHSAGMKAGVAINPHTSVSLLEDIIPDADYILIMSVNPGFGGQSYIPQATEKVKKLKAMIDAANPQCIIQIDGGIGLGNIAGIAAAGCTSFVAGSSVFSAEDPAEMIHRLKTA